MTVATPWAALVGLVGLVPAAVAVVRGRRARAPLRELGLSTPSRLSLLRRPILLCCACVLLGLAAAGPSLRLRHGLPARSDAQVLVVLDGSRSMLAASSPRDPPRYRRAAAFARRLQEALPEVPMGLASLTNRLLPYAFPTVDRPIYDDVLDGAFAVEKPPPAFDADRWVTSFDPLKQTALRRFFSPAARKRVVIVLSDAETRPFDARGVLRQLERHGTTPIVVRFWHPGERIFGADGTPTSYHSTQPGELGVLAAAGWKTFDEDAFGAVVRAIRTTIGSGPVARVGYEQRQESIAPVFVLAALAPLLLLVAPAGVLPLPRSARLPTLRRQRRVAVEAPGRVGDVGVPEQKLVDPVPARGGDLRAYL
jgi:hypothetical protein